MSRVILNDHPWTDEEIEYQKGRNRIKEIAKNKEQFPRGEVRSSGPAPEKVDIDDDIAAKVKELDAEKVSELLEKRGLSTEGELKELKFRLAQDVQKERNAGQS